MKKGFTLVEMVGVIVILSLIVVFAFPIIINSVKNTKSETSDYTLEMIKNAADIFIEDNKNDINQSGTGCIPLSTLVDYGYVKGPVKLWADDTDLTYSKSVLYPYTSSNFKNYIVDSDDYRCNAIPVIYKRVKYIQATGSQYIDPNYKAKPSTGVEVVFQFDSLKVQQRVYGMDSSDTTNPLSYSLYINKWGRLAYAYQNGKGNWVDLGIKANKVMHNVKFNVTSGKLIYDGREISISSTNPTNTSAYNFLIMAKITYGSGNTEPGEFSSIKIYAFKIYENGTLVHNYIPCYRIADNVIGMYDIIGNVFYTNAGTGEFKKGEDINFS